MMSVHCAKSTVRTISHTSDISCGTQFFYDKCKPGDSKNCPEWAIVDLQGNLETRHPVPLGGKFIGDLHFTKKDAPVLIIGHHILFGKVVDLEKPFAVLAKVDQDQENENEAAMETNQINTGYIVQAIIKKKILFKTRPKPIISHVPKKL